MKTNTENGDAITRAMDWLGELRAEEYAEPAFGGDGEPPSAGEPSAAVPRPAGPAARPYVPQARLAGPEFRAAVRGRHAAAGPPVPPAGPPVPAAGPPAAAAAPAPAAPVPEADLVGQESETSSSPPPAERAPIGDELRIPMAWCEMGSCISHYAHPAALGEVDNRSRAIRAGWRIDALGRLACPQCLQGPWFWATQQMAPWDRSRAVAMATLMTAVAAEYDEPAVMPGPAVLPPAEQALAPLPPYDQG